MTDATSETITFLTSIEGFMFGMLGGFLAEFFGWFKLRKILHTSCPDFAESKIYWILTLGMIVVGGIIVFIYIESGFHFQTLVAVNVGATAPLLLEGMIKQTPQVSPGKIN